LEFSRVLFRSQAGAASTPIPGAEIKRTGIGPDWGLARTSSPIATGLDLTAFSPAVYSGGPWGISYIPEGSIASWATPVLLSNGYPVLVAGTLCRARLHVRPPGWVQPSGGCGADLHANRVGVDRGCHLVADAGRALAVSGRGVRSTSATASRPGGGGSGSRLSRPSARRARAWRAR